jgi:uncharacterized phage protein (TIGR02218 family)
VKKLSAALQDHLDGEATTMCYCWRVTRTDGIVQGFTEHDEDITFAGTTFLASSGFTATQVQHSLGLAVDNLNVDGALSSDTLNEDDLAAGKYDDAFVELFWVNWADVSQRILKQTGYTGETQRTGLAFSAELRGLSTRLGQTQTRTFKRTCDAIVGDAACKIDLTASTFRGAGEVQAVYSPRSFSATGIASYDSKWFDQGILTWTSGPASGTSIDVKAHVKDAGLVTIELWNAPAFEIEAGWDFNVTAGCQKTVGMCTTKFNNLVNFRGFPAMPGSDAVIRNPDPSARNTGSSTTSSSK